jgi:hypothetical protein
MRRQTIEATWKRVHVARGCEPAAAVKAMNTRGIARINNRIGAGDLRMRRIRARRPG